MFAIKSNKSIIISLSILLMINLSFGCINQDSTKNSSIQSSNNASTNLDINYSEIKLLPPYNESKPDWLKTNASNIARIALKDIRVQQMIQEGGTIIGVTYSCHPTYEGYEGIGCAPALKIKSKSEKEIVDFLVDEEKEVVAETVTEITSSN